MERIYPSTLVVSLLTPSSMVRLIFSPRLRLLLYLPPLDTFDNPILINPTNGAPTETYELSSTGIAWPGEAKKYVSKPGYTNLSAIVPPPNWQKRFPNGYTEDNVPDLRNDEHFQNWMRTAGLPTFTKLYGRNDTLPMPKGIYRITIGLSTFPASFRTTDLKRDTSDYPVLPYKGTKSFVISTVSWIGGKNPFLGWAYVAAASVFVLLAILGTARHLIKPRYVSLFRYAHPQLTP